MQAPRLRYLLLIGAALTQAASAIAQGVPPATITQPALLRALGGQIPPAPPAAAPQAPAAPGIGVNPLLDRNDPTIMLRQGQATAAEGGAIAIGPLGDPGRQTGPATAVFGATLFNRAAPSPAEAPTTTQVMRSFDQSPSRSDSSDANRRRGSNRRNPSRNASYSG